MADNTLTCKTGTVVAVSTDVGFTITQRTQNHGEGLFMYVNFIPGTASTSITFTFAVADNSIGTGTLYSLVSVSGTAVSALTYTFAGTKKYKIPIPLGTNESTLVVSATYSLASDSGTCDIKIMED